MWVRADSSSRLIAFPELKRRLQSQAADSRGVDEKVLMKVVELYGAALHSANDALLADWYRRVAAAPQTLTRTLIQDQHGLSFDRFFNCTPSRQGIFSMKDECQACHILDKIFMVA